MTKKSPIRFYQRWILKRCKYKCKLWDPKIGYVRAYWWVRVTDSNMYYDKSGRVSCPVCETINSEVVRITVTAELAKDGAFLEEGKRKIEKFKLTESQKCLQ